MYSCVLRISLIGLDREQADCISSLEPLEAFSHEVSVLSLAELTSVSNADIVLASLPDDALPEKLEHLLRKKRESSKVVIIVASESRTKLEPFLPYLEDVWIAPLSIRELELRFRHLLQGYKQAIDLWQTTQYLDATIDSIPSLVWYKTKDGIHEKVNDSFCVTVRKTKEQVQGRRHAYIWDVEEDDPVCIESENIVMASGKTCVSEEEVQTGEGTRLLTTYKTPLYNIDGQVMGTVGVGIDITQERAYEQDLTDKNKTLETIFASLDCGVLIHSLDGSRILGVNQSALDILGYRTEQELMDGGFFQIAPTVIEEDRESLISAIRQLHNVGDSVSAQYRVRRDDGSMVHVMGDLKMIEKDGERYIQRFLLDITDQKNSEEQRKRRQRSLMQALSADYIVVYAFNLDDGSSELLRISSEDDLGLMDIFTEGRNFEEALEQYVQVRVIEEDREMLREALSAHNIRKELAAKQRFDRLYHVQKGDHEVVYRQASVVSADGAGGSYVVIGFRNVDQQIREELEQKALLKKALIDANRASQAKSAFLLNMSHDIRTPMNAIVGFTTLAHNYLEQPDKIGEYLDKIKTSSDHLLSLINDVLDMSRIEQGKVSLEEDACDLSEVMEELHSLLHSEAETRGLDLQVEMIDIKHPHVICDRLKLKQILLNLLGNSLKFTPQGSVSIRLQEFDRLDPDKGLYRFTVKDTGIGMSQSFLERIFDPFERERTQTISGVQGSGLGMAIVKNLVDMMKGAVQVESVEGEGTEFVVDIPLRFASESSIHSCELAHVHGSIEITEMDAFNPKDYRVLLVDDNQLNREIAMELLTDVGFEVECAENGQEAVDRIAFSDNDYFDLVLMDIQMPIMDGYQATRSIRALDDEKRANIPILAVTADAFEEDRLQALECGMDGHIPKPIDVDMLCEVMVALLNVQS